MTVSMNHDYLQDLLLSRGAQQTAGYLTTCSSFTLRFVLKRIPHLVKLEVLSKIEFHCFTPPSVCYIASKVMGLIPFFQIKSMPENELIDSFNGGVLKRFLSLNNINSETDDRPGRAS